MRIYQNDNAILTVGELYDEFNIKFANHPVRFDNSFSITGGQSSLKLDFFPISDTDKLSIRIKQPTDTDYTEITDYSIDYLQGIITLNNTYPDGTEVLFSGFYRKINLQQFITYLNGSIRYLSKYYPIAVIVEDILDGATYIELTKYNLLDVKRVYKDLSDKKPINFIRRGNRIFFVNNDLSYDDVNRYFSQIIDNYTLDTLTYSDYGAPIIDSKKDIDISVEYDNLNNIQIFNQISGNIYIEGTYKHKKLVYTSNMSTNLNQTILWKEDAIDLLLTKIGLYMYEWLAHLNTRINVSSLKLDISYINSMINMLGRNLGLYLRDGKRNRGLYDTYLDNRKL